MKIDKEKAIKLWERGCIDKEIAKEFKCATQNVAKFRKKNGMESNVGIFDWIPSDFVDESPRRYNKRGL